MFSNRLRMRSKLPRGPIPKRPMQTTTSRAHFKQLLDDGNPSFVRGNEEARKLPFTLRAQIINKHGRMMNKWIRKLNYDKWKGEMP